MARRGGAALAVAWTGSLRAAAIGSFSVSTCSSCLGLTFKGRFSHEGHVTPVIGSEGREEGAVPVSFAARWNEVAIKGIITCTRELAEAETN